MEISTTLLREKFVIRTASAAEEGVPMTVASNRLVIPLMNAKGDVIESFVIRSKNMHNCIRLAAVLIQAFQRAGALLNRPEPFSFEDAWTKLCSDHDRKYYADQWVSVYHKGKLIYEVGEPHLFLSVIEKCDAKNPGNYDGAVDMAEKSFAEMGRKVNISYTSNIGMVITAKPQMARGGLILRSPHKTTTFNFVVEQSDSYEIQPFMIFNICAAFLEGIQLGVRIGMANEKLRQNLIEKFSPEMKEAQSALGRLAQLNTEIRSFENRYGIRYRPEKPEFSMIVTEAERFQMGLIDQARAKAEAEAEEAAKAAAANPA
ncbi:MAG: hypothetical protein WC043_05905 [Pseudobdellovibrionaceae bacterium]